MPSATASRGLPIRTSLPRAAPGPRSSSRRRRGSGPLGAARADEAGEPQNLPFAKGEAHVLHQGRATEALHPEHLGAGLGAAHAGGARAQVPAHHPV